MDDTIIGNNIKKIIEEGLKKDKIKNNLFYEVRGGNKNIFITIEFFNNESEIDFIKKRIEFYINNSPFNKYIKQKGFSSTNKNKDRFSITFTTILN